MSSRLDRLMRLAQKTGDTLIIHDREGRDLVLLDVDRYESLIDEEYDCCGSFEDMDMYDMSEGQMRDKINRDIAVWRSHEEDEERGSRARALERHMAEHPLPDPFEEDFSHSSDWHKAGSVLEERHPRFRDEVSFEDDHMPNYRFGSNAEPDFGPVVNPYLDDDEDLYDEDDEDLDDEEFDPNFDPFGLDEVPKSDKATDTLIYDSLAEDSLYDTSDKKNIPFIEHGSVEMRTGDDDEPVFFEEPI